MDRTLKTYEVIAREEGTFNYREITKQGDITHTLPSGGVGRILIETAKGLVRKLGVKEVKLEARS